MRNGSGYEARLLAHVCSCDARFALVNVRWIDVKAAINVHVVAGHDFDQCCTIV